MLSISHIVYTDALACSVCFIFSLNEISALIDVSFVMLIYFAQHCNTRLSLNLVSGSSLSDEDHHQLSGVSAGESQAERQSEDWREAVRPAESVQDIQFIQ